MDNYPCAPRSHGRLRLQLKRAIRHVLEERDWWGLPRYLLGASAGGAVALLFASRFPVQVRAPYSPSIRENFPTSGSFAPMMPHHNYD